MKQEKETRKKLPYQIVRTYSAGVFAGHVVKRNARNPRNARTCADRQHTFRPGAVRMGA